MNLLKKSAGNTMMYLLAAFLVVSFVGTAMIKLSHHDVTASSDYASTSSAEEAARSGIQATEVFITGNSQAFADTLNKYIANPKSYWILGDTTSANRVAIDGQLSFASELVAFSYAAGSNQFNITVKSYGYGRDKSQKIITSVIDLSGIDWATTTVATFAPMAAFRLGGNTDFESNCNITIDGFTYISGKLTTNGQDFTFNGDFYQAAATGARNILNGGTFTFNGKMYSAIEWWSTGSNEMIFNGVAGFDAGIIWVADMPVFKSNIYHNGQYFSNNGLDNKSAQYGWGTAKITIDGGDVYSVSSAGNYGGHEYFDQMCNGVGNQYQLTTAMDIPDSLGFGDLPPDLTIDETVLTGATSYYTNANPTITNGGDLTTIYNTALAAGDTLCGGFVLILEDPSWNGDPSAVVIKDDDGSKIDGKIILIQTRNHSIPNFPECEPDANVVFISRTTNTTAQFGGMDYFRGILFVDGVGFQFQPEAPTIIDGATYFADGARHYNNGGVGIYYKYNEDVLNEIACMGLISDGTTTTTASTTILELVAAAITPTQLGLHF